MKSFRYIISVNPYNTIPKKQAEVKHFAHSSAKWQRCHSSPELLLKPSMSNIRLYPTQLCSENLEALSLQWCCELLPSPPIPGDAWQVLTEGMGQPTDEQGVYVGTGLLCTSHRPIQSPRSLQVEPMSKSSTELVLADSPMCGVGRHWVLYPKTVTKDTSSVSNM